jgi:hypothetical protein
MSFHKLLGSIEPPLHPALLAKIPEIPFEQSTNCCSDKSGGGTFLVLAHAPSTDATAANVQQLPHLP